MREPHMNAAKAPQTRRKSMTYIDISLKLPSAHRTARIRFANDESQHDVAKKLNEPMEMEMKKLIAILALCIASTGVMAQTAPQPMTASPRMERMMEQLQERFAAANTTHDGK